MSELRKNKKGHLLLEWMLIFTVTVMSLLFCKTQTVLADGIAWTHLPFQKELVVPYFGAEVFTIEMPDQLKNASSVDVKSSNPNVAKAIALYEDGESRLWVMYQGTTGSTTFTITVNRYGKTNIYKTTVKLVPISAAGLRPFSSVKIGNSSIEAKLHNAIIATDVRIPEGNNKISISTRSGWKIVKIEFPYSKGQIANNSIQNIPAGDETLRIIVQNTSNKMICGYEAWITSVKSTKTISLNKTSLTIVKGKTEKLNVTLKNVKGKIKWSSNKRSVAAVSSSGKITAKKAGTAVITAKVGNISASCKVTVKNPTVKLSQTTCTLQKGKTFTLKATITGKSSKVTWTSSNKKVCIVNSKGVIKAKKAGTAVITAKANGVKATCKVTISKAAAVQSDKQKAMSAYQNLLSKTIVYVDNKSSGPSFKPASCEFALAYIDNDSIPELYIRAGSFKCLYTWKNKVVCVAYGEDNEWYIEGYYERKNLVKEWHVDTFNDIIQSYYSAIKQTASEGIQLNVRLSGDKSLYWSYGKDFVVGRDRPDALFWAFDSEMVYPAYQITHINKSTFDSQLLKYTGARRMSTFAFRKNSSTNRKKYLK